MTSTTKGEGPSRRARVVLVIIVVLLAALVVWKFVDYRRTPPSAAGSQPAASALAPSSERIDALRYLAQAKASGDLASEGFDHNRMAEAQADAGDFAGAQVTIGRITDDFEKAMTLGYLAAAQAIGDQAGAKQSFELAKAAADAVTPDWSKSLVLGAIASARSRAGHWAEAKTMVSAIADEEDRNGSLAAIVADQAKAGDIAGKATPRFPRGIIFLSDSAYGCFGFPG